VVETIGIDTGSSLWLYQWDKGLMLVYLYFQIPLMLIVFLPAVEGIKPQWREATETLGGTTWTYWRRVAGPILLPSFIGAMLLLFTNAFSAYATAAALISAGSARSCRCRSPAPSPPRSSSARRTSARRWRWRWSSSWLSSCGSTPGWTSGPAGGWSMRRHPR
jgi:ABC-type phosphate transport system permease subunit